MCIKVPVITLYSRLYILINIPNALINILMTYLKGRYIRLIIPKYQRLGHLLIVEQDYGCELVVMHVQPICTTLATT